MVDIPNAIDTIRHFAGWADKIEGRWVTPLPMFGHARQAYTIREPLGVDRRDHRLERPTLIATWKLGPALAPANAVVIKPSEDAPLTSLHLAALIEEVGFPAGVVNVLPGSARRPAPRSRAIPASTRSASPAAPRSAARSPSRPPGTSAASRSSSAASRPRSCWRTPTSSAVAPGHRRRASSRTRARSAPPGRASSCAREQYDDVVAGLADAARGVHLGDPFDPDTTMGALINRQQRDRVTGYIAEGKADGAELVTGGGQPDRPGYFVEPTVFADPTTRSGSPRTRSSGRSRSCSPSTTRTQAIKLANDTRYGLAAYVWTQNLSEAHRLAAQLKAGGVWINGPGAPDARLPWGGVKTSGIGRELGWAGIEATPKRRPSPSRSDRRTPVGRAGAQREEE